MSSDAKVLEYALVVTTASSRNHTTSELRAKYSENGRTHSLSIPMTVADYAGKMEDRVDITTFIEDAATVQK